MTRAELLAWTARLESLPPGERDWVALSRAAKGMTDQDVAEALGDVVTKRAAIGSVDCSLICEALGRLLHGNLCGAGYEYGGEFHRAKRWARCVKAPGHEGKHAGEESC